MNKKEQIKDLIVFFAELYKKPTIELFEVINNEPFEHELADALDLHINSFSLNKPTSFEEMVTEYDIFFSHSETINVPLVESYYKPWTTDRTAVIPFASCKGLFMGDAAWHIQYILKELNIEFSECYNSMPDHISVILELATIFIEDQDKFLRFIESHLDWLNDLILQMKQVKTSSFYILMTEFLQKFIKNTLDIAFKEEYVC